MTIAPQSPSPLTATIRFAVRLGIIVCVATPLIGIPLVYGWAIVARWSADREFARSQLENDPGEDGQSARRVVARMLAEQRSNYFAQLKSLFSGRERTPLSADRDVEQLSGQRPNR